MQGKRGKLADKPSSLFCKFDRESAGMSIGDSEQHVVYNAGIDKVDENKWAELLMLFDDASIHQTWPTGRIMKGEKNLSHVVLRRDEEIIGICQISIKELPVLNTGLADVYNGPLWRKSGGDLDIDNFRQMVSYLKNEYGLKRGFLLRIWPNEFQDSDNEFSTILKSMGFHQNTSAPQQRTLLMDLSASLEVLRKNLSKTWRLHLNRAEKSKLNIIDGTNDKLYEIFMKQLKEMLERKQFLPNVNYDKYRIIQKELPENLKMKIMVCEFEGNPMSSIICSAIGNTGVYLFGATANEGLKMNASNLLHWKMIQWLKEKGYNWYDLGGINPEENPGTYQFKRGLVGEVGKDRTKVGQFDFCGNLRAHLVSTIVRRINPLRHRIFSMRISSGK